MSEPAILVQQQGDEPATRSVSVDEARLIGLDDQQLRDVLGQPKLTREERPAQYWQYAVNGCVMVVFLYDDDRAAQPRVAHYEVRSPEPYIPARYDDCERLDERLKQNERGRGRPAVISH